MYRFPYHIHSNRKPNRLSGYDYSSPGAYFVTIWTNTMEILFGEIKNGIMIENSSGKIIRQEWYRPAEIRQNVQLLNDEFVVMPNHIHGIIWILDVGTTGPVAQSRISYGLISESLGSIIGQFKSTTTKRINKNTNNPGKSVWQRNYYNHIIRNEDDYLAIRQYIQNYPQNWELEQYIPDNLPEQE